MSPRRFALNVGPYFSSNKNLQEVDHIVDVRSDPEKMTKFELYYKRSLPRTLDRADTDSEAFFLISNFFWGQENGVILELGALDGVIMSQSRELLDFRWKRILVEGSPLFKHRLATRSRDALSFNVCVCDAIKAVHFAHARGIGGVIEFMDRKFVEAFHSGFLTTPKNEWLKYSNVQQVQCVPLSILINETGLTHINAFILDVEGGELNVLKTIDWNSVRFDIIIVETEEKYRPLGYGLEIRGYLESKKYVFVFNEGRNSYFCRADFVAITRNSSAENFSRMKLISTV